MNHTNHTPQCPHWHQLPLIMQSLILNPTQTQWMTQGNLGIPCIDMDESHLLNTANYLVRNLKRDYCAMVLPRPANWACALHEDSRWSLGSFVMILEELRRRGLTRWLYMGNYKYHDIDPFRCPVTDPPWLQRYLDIDMCHLDIVPVEKQVVVPDEKQKYLAMVAAENQQREKEQQERLQARQAHQDRQRAKAEADRQRCIAQDFENQRMGMFSHMSRHNQGGSNPRQPSTQLVPNKRQRKRAAFEARKLASIHAKEPMTAIPPRQREVHL